MWKNAYLSIKNPKASRARLRALDPGLQIARFAHVTLLCYIGNFQPQNLGPPWPNPGSAPCHTEWSLEAILYSGRQSSGFVNSAVIWSIVANPWFPRRGCQHQGGYLFLKTAWIWKTNRTGGGGVAWMGQCYVTIHRQWRIQDFPQGGRQLPKVLLFFNFLLKTAWKWKNLDPQGGRASLAPPLDPPMTVGRSSPNMKKVKSEWI